MAYYNQAMKKQHAPQIKALLAEYGMKGSLSVRHHSTVVLTVKSGPIDFGRSEYPTFTDVNVYWIHEHYTGVAQEFLQKAYKILMQGNHNNNDIQSDYFDVGWYVDIQLGRWSTPYEMTTVAEAA
jgi:hypothetical protein